MMTSKNFIQNYASCPYICLLGVRKIISHLLWRLVQKSAAFQEISDTPNYVVFASQAKVNDFDLRKVRVISNEEVIWFQISMNYILFIVHVYYSLQQSLHQLCALLLRQRLPVLFPIVL